MSDLLSYPTPARPLSPASPAIGAGPLPLVDEAEALQGFLREALARNARLLAGLKQQRKQSRLVASTLASLRQLGQVQG